MKKLSFKEVFEDKVIQIQAPWACEASQVILPVLRYSKIL